MKNQFKDQSIIQYLKLLINIHRELFKLFNNQKNAEVENIDIVGLHENMKNSFVSDVDISFALISKQINIIFSDEDLFAKENDNDVEEEDYSRSKSMGKFGGK